MTSLEWCHIQTQDPILSQIMREINNKSLGKMKIKMGMPSELKALIRNRTQLILKHGVLYKKARVNAKNQATMVVPQSYRQRAMEGCHDQIGHLGQDRVLDLLRDRFYWPGMHADVVSYINSCPRCLRRKSQQDKAPLMNIETSQPLELIHLYYLKIEPSKGNIENVLVITDLLGMHKLFLQKLKQHWPQLNCCGTISFFTMAFLKYYYRSKTKF